MLRESILLLLFIFFCYSQGLKVSKVEVPRFLLVGESATLKCHFSLDGEKLYSLKWWKDDRQFYQYIPRNEPKMVVFEIPGISVNRKKSGIHLVELVNIQHSSHGQYKCEVVGEAPFFTTHILGSNLSVIDPPDGPPVVRGQKSIYHPGEIINLNCTSYRSKPIPHLQWEIMKYDSIATTATTEQIFTSRFTKGSSIPFEPSNKPLLSSNSPLKSTSSLIANPPSRNRGHREKKYTQAFLSSLWDFSLSHFTSNSLEKSHLDSPKQLETYSKRGRKHRMALSPQRPTLYRSSNYSLVDPKHLLTYPAQTSGEFNSKVYSLTLGIQYPATLKEAPKGEISFRCKSIIHKYRWATEVKVAIAEIPVADPQQLPTLHGTGAPRGICCSFLPNNLLIASLLLLLRR